MTELSERSVTLWVLDIRRWIDPIESLLRGECLNGRGLSAEAIETLGRFVRREDARRGAGGELLRRIALGEYGGAELSDADVLREPGVKPRLPAFTDVHFNISHSGSMVVCCVDTHPVGVDVEQHRPVDPGLPAACLVPSELEWLRRGHDRPHRFYTLWTVKESLLKAIGAGLSIDPLQIEVAPVDREERTWRLQATTEYSADGRQHGMKALDSPLRSALERMVVRTVKVGDGYSAAVATVGPVAVGVRRPAAPSGRYSRSANQFEQSH